MKTRFAFRSSSRSLFGFGLALTMVALIATPIAAQTAPDLVGPITVVVEVSLEPNATAEEALVALDDMRSLMRRQAGYLSEEFLQNLNANNAPRYVHVSRWATMTYWAALFRTPEFSKFNTHGSSHFSIAVMALLPAEQMPAQRK